MNTYYVWAYIEGRWNYMATLESDDSFEEACREAWKGDQWYRAEDNTYWSAEFHSGCSLDEYNRRKAAVTPLGAC